MFVSPGGEEVLFVYTMEVRTIVKELPGGDVPPGGEDYERVARR